MRKIIRLICIAMAAVMVLPFALSSCSVIGYKTDELKPTELDNKLVGKIGDYDIYYDEYSFLALEYRKSLEYKYGEGIWDDPETAEKYREELEALVFEGIKANYVILTLCDEYGYKNALKKRDIKKSVDSYIYTLVCAAYDEKYNSGSTSSNGETGTTTEAATDEDTTLTSAQMKEAYAYYEKTLREEGLTDRVMRIFIGVEYAESKLYDIFCEKELIPYSDDDIWEIMTSDDFICTDHIFLKCENDEDFEKKYAKAVEVRDALRQGDVELEDYIRNGTDQDLSRPSTAGYYFVKGSMDEAYEDAAFELEVGGISDVVKTDDGYYVIKRFEKDRTFMNTHISQYSNQISYAKMLEIVNARRAELSLELNDFGKTLDLVTLAPDSTLSTAGK